MLLNFRPTYTPLTVSTSNFRREQYPLQHYPPRPPPTPIDQPRQVSSPDRPFKDLNRPFSNINTPFIDLNRPFRDLNRSFRDLNRPYDVRCRLIHGLNGPFKCCNRRFIAPNNIFLISWSLFRYFIGTFKGPNHHLQGFIYIFKGLVSL